MNKELRYIYWNKASEKLTGVPAENAIGRSLTDVFPDNESTRTVRTMCLRAMETQQPQCFTINYPAGDNLIHEISAYPTEQGVSLIAKDITNRKRAEENRAKLEAQLQQSQKMESVGLLAGGVAHDFNNMLGVILGHAEMAMEMLKSPDLLQTHLTEIRNAAKRSADLTRQLLAFARKQPVAPKVLDLNKTIDGMLKMLQRLIGESIHLDWKPEANLWPVKVDPSQIDQILANLCVNARDAIAGVGKITIVTGNIVIDKAYCTVHAEFVPGEHVMLGVSDDGCGMDKDTQAHIFEPFFTTKERDKGTGLGLSMVYGIVKQNNGFIYVYSELGRGTTFKIYLPGNMGEVALEETEDAAEPLMRGNETILLVEDERAILNMITRVLERQGYTVLQSSTSDEALRLVKDYSGEIHLLITDVVMPVMNGWDLAKNLLSLFPRLKCLFMSGYTSDIIARENMPDQEAHFIQKPFHMQDLTAKVRKMLVNE
jgi:two-component system, cell cycle sensor histidine kinase and response regulator CckA